MSVECTRCGAGLPEAAMHPDYPGCPHCREIDAARAVAKKTLEVLEEILTLIKEARNQ